MASNSAQLWTYAQTLETPCEESRRAKISRAYYALYHHARDFHDALPEDARGQELAVGGGVHKKLIQKLTNPTLKDESAKKRSRSIGTFLGLARDLRDQADYDNQCSIGNVQVSQCLGFVKKGLDS
ncbi:hypothetical protein [Achromobacter sp. UBA2119]|uniref:hypothetical protein n=1 Tax=Achromobacter sp. UBA2119 TaxID=1945911 RepID=UPI00257C700D|nr:hypothetical protein [Achromobacter sp. UBA2119]